MKKKKVEIYLYVLYSQLAFPFPSRKGGGRGGSVLVFFHQEEADSPSNLYLFSTTSIRCTISFQSFRILLEGSFKARAPETMLIEIVSATAEVDVDVDARNEARPLRKKTFNTSASSSSREEFIFSPPRAHLSRRSFFHYYNLYKNF